jgi:hypothetical protein
MAEVNAPQVFSLQIQAVEVEVAKIPFSSGIALQQGGRIERGRGGCRGIGGMAQGKRWKETSVKAEDAWENG